MFGLLILLLYLYVWTAYFVVVTVCFCSFLVLHLYAVAPAYRFNIKKEQKHTIQHQKRTEASRYDNKQEQWVPGGRVPLGAGPGSPGAGPGPLGAGPRGPGAVVRDKNKKERIQKLLLSG